MSNRQCLPLHEEMALLVDKPLNFFQLITLKYILKVRNLKHFDLQSFYTNVHFENLPLSIYVRIGQAAFCDW